MKNFENLAYHLNCDRYGRLSLLKKLKLEVHNLDGEKKQKNLDNFQNSHNVNRNASSKSKIPTFFQHFIDHNGFNYCIHMSPLENFEKLARHLNCTGNGRLTLRERYREEVTNSIKQSKHCEISENSDFFENFIDNNGFEFDSCISLIENFENLVDHLRCSRAGRETLFRRFMEEVFNTEDFEEYLDAVEKTNKRSKTTNFFQHYIYYNGFEFDSSISLMENFEDLVDHLRSCENGRLTLLERLNEDIWEFYSKKRAEKIKECNRIESTEIPKVFQRFIKTTRFKFNHNLTLTENFLGLIRYFKFEKNEKLALLDKFTEEVGDCLFQKKLRVLEIFDQDLDNIMKVTSVEQFFNYFGDKYNFLLEDISGEYLSAFYTLSEQRGWTNIFNRKQEKFESLTEEDKKIYLKANFTFYELTPKPRSSLSEQFDHLAEYLHWKNYYRLFKNVFMKLIGENAQEKLKNLKELKIIILRYKLMPESEIPDDFDLCLKIVREKLFVNIYDFCNPNNTLKFEDEGALVDYTFDNKLFYPKREAKKKFSLKILLRHIFE